MSPFFHSMHGIAQECRPQNKPFTYSIISRLEQSHRGALDRIERGEKYPQKYHQKYRTSRVAQAGLFSFGLVCDKGCTFGFILAWQYDKETYLKMRAQQTMDFVDTLAAGAQVDSYRVEALVAHGRMAAVYRAVDTRDGRALALKIPNPDLEADPVLFERFKREAAIGEKLHHPGVMRVYDEVERSRVYMVMEWCEGRPLRQIINEGKMAPDRAIRIAIAVLDALQYIHDNGVVHRALRPESILVDADDKVKLIDFGYAADATARRLTYANLTADLGTPDYISPEQVQGKRGDSRSDIYAMGVILYEMLTGKLPFTGSSPSDVMNNRLLNHPIPPSVAEPSISSKLQEVLYRALERDPKNRYARAHDFARDLQHLDRVGVTDRPELRNWRKRTPHMTRRIAMYVVLLLIPLTILIAMVLLSRSK